MIVEELAARLGLEIDGVAFSKAEMALHGLRSGFMAFAAAAVTGATVVAAALIKTTANAGDAAYKTAQSTGLQVEALQEMAYAARLADVEQEELARGLQRLAKSGVKDVRAEMLRLADQFEKMPDGGEKVKIAMEKLGKSVGPKLIPLLNGGRKEMEALMREARELGLVFSKEDAQAAEKFNDELTRLSAQFEGMRNRIGIKLIPLATKLVIKLQEWTRVVRSWLSDSNNLKLLTSAVVSLAAAFLLVKGAAVGAALASIAAWTAAAAPIAALAALLFGVYVLFDDILGFLTGKDSLLGRMLGTEDSAKLRAFLDKTTNVIAGAFSVLWDGIGNSFEELLQGRMLGAVKTFVNSIGNAQTLALGAAYDYVSGKMIDAFAPKVHNVWDTPGSEFTSGPTINMNVVQNPGEDGGAFASRAAKHVVDGLSDLRAAQAAGR